MPSNINPSTDEKLKIVAQEGDINALYTLIQEDQYVLERVDSIPFVETPLHIAASAGKIEFATELMRLKPSYSQKLNQQGFSPIHLAMEQGHDKMVLRFVDINKDLVKVKGREGLTPLHLASQKGDVGLLKEFLEASPDSIKDMTVRSETALHIAVIYKQYEALQFLICWLRRGTIDLERTILNLENQEGNTILHISLLNNDREVLKWFPSVRAMMDLTAKNVEGKTASEITGSPEIKNLLNAAGKKSSVIRDFMISCGRTILSYEALLQEECNAYLVVAALIAAATYQAALSPPGGLYQADPGTPNTLSHLNTKDSSINGKATTGIGGNSIMPDGDFLPVEFTNMLSFFYSTFAILYLLPKKHIWWLLLATATIFLQLSYIFSVMVISPTTYTTRSILAFYVIFMVVSHLILCIITYNYLTASRGTKRKYSHVNKNMIEL